MHRMNGVLRPNCFICYWFWFGQIMLVLWVIVWKYDYRCSTKNMKRQKTRSQLQCQCQCQCLLLEAEDSVAGRCLFGVWYFNSVGMACNTLNTLIQNITLTILKCEHLKLLPLNRISFSCGNNYVTIKNYDFFNMHVYNLTLNKLMN